MKLNIHTINPYIRVAMHSRLRPGKVISRRVIFDYELIYIEEGKLRFMYDERIYLCEPGSFVLIRPGIPHSFQVGDAELSQPHIHFDMCFAPDSHAVPISFRDIPDFTAAEQSMIRPDFMKDYPRTPFVTFSEPHKALTLFYEIVSVPRDSRTLLQKARLTELLHLLIQDNFPECLEDSRENSYDVCAQIKAFIDAGQGITASLEDLEKQYSYSRYYLERKFKQTYGISLIAYRNARRMQRAKILLQTESVSATAEKLGFSSVYAFSRAYKKHYGVCPSQYRSSLGK